MDLQDYEIMELHITKGRKVIFAQYRSCIARNYVNCK
jgi:hypothetical protein